jgi:hypothetical protein
MGQALIKIVWHCKFQLDIQLDYLFPDQIQSTQIGAIDAYILEIEAKPQM